MVRARAKITSDFRTPSSGRLRLLINRINLKIAMLFFGFRSIFATKSDLNLTHEFSEVISTRAPRRSFFKAALSLLLIPFFFGAALLRRKARGYRRLKRLTIEEINEEHHWGG